MTAEHRCPHCGHVQLLDREDTGPDRLVGTFPEREEAATHAVLRDNVLEVACSACGQTAWAAFVDQRW